jgi:hypothetical protein
LGVRARNRSFAKVVPKQEFGNEGKAPHVLDKLPPDLRNAFENTALRTDIQKQRDALPKD